LPFPGEVTEIEPGNVREFYECWKDNEATCKAMELTLSSIPDNNWNITMNFTVIKVRELECQGEIGIMRRQFRSDTELNSDMC